MKNAKLKYLIASLLTLHAGVVGATPQVVYRSPHKDEVEFAAERIAHRETIGYDEYMAERLVSPTLKHHLQEAYTRAQVGFLQSEVAKMQTDWQDVTAFAYKADWESVQREMIQSAYMRLAQIANDSDQTRLLLREAAQFNPNYEPDRKHFPPPLIQQYQYEKSRLIRARLTTEKFKGFTLLFINGERYTLADHPSLEVVSGTKRITLLSPTYETITRILEVEDLVNFQPERRLLAGALVAAKKTVSKKALNVIEATDGSNVSPSPYLTSEAEPSIEKPFTKDRERAFYEKPKFWIGAGIVAGTILILNGMKKESAPQDPPTHREGL